MAQRIPKLDVICGGTSREFGEQLGDGLRDRIAATTQSLAEYEPFRVQQPWWLPFDWYQQWSEWWAMSSLKEPIANAFPHIPERLEGMAAGAQVRLATLYLFHAFESLVIATDTADAPRPLAACSAIAVPRASATDHRTILAHNLDGVDLLGVSLVLRENRHAGQYRSLGLTCAPLSGIVDGINEHGLSVTYNWAFAIDCLQMAAPVSVAIDDALANCRSVEQAVKRITARPRHGGAMLMLADAEGDIASLELSNQRFHLRRPHHNRPLFHSNQYRSREMQAAQVRRCATYSNHAVQALRGRRVFSSPEQRDHRLRQLLRERRSFSPASLTELLADHGRDQIPSDDTICMHGELWTTQASIQLVPAKRLLRLSYGPACEAKHVEFAL